MDASSDLKLSPLNDVHARSGARLIPFAGWNMPVQYTGITEEHLAVRQSAGIFDISHMGQFLVTGENAADWLNGLLTNDVKKLGPEQGQYSLMLNERGGVIDDLILYRSGNTEFFVVVNASKIDEDREWMRARLTEGVSLSDDSRLYAGMAIQGPEAMAVFTKTLAEKVALPPRNGIREFGSAGGRNFVCRTGYTGEDGFEFFCPAAEGPVWWDAFVAAGARACGLGARDTLRLEMCYPLNGNDLSPERTPLEAGLGFFVNFEKGPFIGGEVLQKQKAEGVPSRLAALKMIDKGPPPRAHYPVFAGDRQLGEICSGGVSPSLGAGIAMAYLPPDFAAPGTRVEVDIRGRRFAAEVVKKPFYRRPA